MTELAPFGTAFGTWMASARWAEGGWDQPKLGPVEAIPLHPASHVLHYGSSCFEGLKALAGVDGSVRIFRLDRHVERMRASAERLYLPAPPADMLTEMVVDTVTANRHQVPEPPASLYIRPTLIGTAPNIGAAGSPTSEALLFILTSPVGDYFSGGLRPLRIAVESHRPRTTPQFGSVKTGANYAMALGITMEARDRYEVDQVLFTPGGILQETGASNVVLLDDATVVTPALDGSFLEGVTRASILDLARDMGLRAEEKTITVDDLLAWEGEVALTGTGAVMAPVGTFVVDGEDHPVGDAGVGPATLRMRQALIDVQTGHVPDPHHWNVVL